MQMENKCVLSSVGFSGGRVRKEQEQFLLCGTSDKCNPQNGHKKANKVYVIHYYLLAIYKNKIHWLAIYKVRLQLCHFN